VADIIGHQYFNSSCHFINDHYVISGSFDRTVKVWNLDLVLQNKFVTVDKHNRFVAHISLTSDDKYIVTGSVDNTIKIWDKNTVKSLRTITAHEDRVNSCSITSDNKYIVSSSNDNTIKIFELETGKEIRSITAHTKGVRCSDVSYDKKFILSIGTNETNVKLWDFETGNMVIEIPNAHTNALEYCKFSKDGSFFGTCSRDGTAKIWDTKTTQLKKTLEGHKDDVLNMDFSSDGNFVVTGGLDKTVRVHNLQTNTTVVSEHSGRVLNVGYSLNGKYVVSASWDKTVKLWSPAGKYLVTIDDAENFAISNTFIVTATYSQHNLIVFKLIE